jgi:sugar O-acyltransferase (sialic acid O-acetyltransferase NeuD family)
MGEVWFWGAGGHAASIFETLHAMGLRLAGVIDPFTSRTDFCGAPVHAEPPFPAEASFSAVIALGDNTQRRRVHGEVCARFPNLRLPVLCHPSAAVAHNATLGDGTVVLQHATVGAECRIGRGCVINTACSIDHEGVVGEFSSIAPGAILGGRVTIGDNAFIGIGAVVLQGRTISGDIVVGGSSFVNSDLIEPGAYWGRPAKRHKSSAEVAGFLSR